MAAKYVKLGKKAKGGSFFEANNQVSLYGDKIQKIGTKAFRHARIQRAINAGHLVVVTEEAYEDWKEDNVAEAEKGEKSFDALLPKKGKDKKPATDTSDEDDEDDDVDYMELNKTPLVAYALEVEGVDFSEEELNDMTKAEIQAEIAEALAEDED